MIFAIIPVLPFSREKRRLPATFPQKERVKGKLPGNDPLK
jgi:hypothetical protein